MIDGKGTLREHNEGKNEQLIKELQNSMMNFD